jgi:three-Cys-motif partner protein
MKDMLLKRSAASSQRRLSQGRLRNPSFCELGSANYPPVFVRLNLIESARNMAASFHKERRAWFQIKHQIVGTYLSLFLGKLGKSGDRVYYIDGFAGQGRLEDGTEGSALIAARLAAEPVQKSRKGILQCINVEADSATFENLKTATAPFSHCVTNLHGTFQDKLPEILKLIGGHTAFFFIDPFGTQGAEISTLRELAARSGKTEALVRYDDTRVKRLIMWSANNLENLEEKHRKVALGLLARVRELTDDEAAEKVQMEALLGSDSELRDRLIEGYEGEVKRKTKFTFGLNYPIRNPATGGHRYYLVHFCKFVDGYTHMANFMARAERTYQKLHSGEPELFGGCPIQQTFLQIDDHLAKQVESENVEAIAMVIPEIVIRNRWENKQMQLRNVLGEVVNNFKWRTTRAEWIKALRQGETNGWLKLTGTDDGDAVHFAEKI